jgi:predicted ATPase with chaperone activity
VPRYRRRISGLLLDRIELHVEKLLPIFDELIPSRRSPRRVSTAPRRRRPREQVEYARTRAVARQGPRKNSKRDGAELEPWTR